MTWHRRSAESETEFHFREHQALDEQISGVLADLWSHQGNREALIDALCRLRTDLRKHFEAEEASELYVIVPLDHPRFSMHWTGSRTNTGK